MSNNKKTVANEIVMIFRQLKIALICGIVWFFGFLLYKKFFDYLFSNEYISMFEAQEILGYIPDPISPYPLHSEGYNSLSMEEKTQIVKDEILNHLLEDAFLSTLIFIPIAFGVILLYHYIMRSFKWIQKYSD